MKETNPDDPHETQWILTPGRPPRLDHPDNACTCDDHAENKCLRDAAELVRLAQRRYVAARRQLTASILRHLTNHRTCRRHRTVADELCAECGKAALAAELHSRLQRYEPHPLWDHVGSDL